MQKTTDHPLRAPRITAAVLVIGSFLLMAGTVYGFWNSGILDLFYVILCAIVLAAISFSAVIALRKRKQELERGEEAEAQQY